MDVGHRRRAAALAGALAPRSHFGHSSFEKRAESEICEVVWIEINPSVPPLSSVPRWPPNEPLNGTNAEVARLTQQTAAI